MPEKHYTSRQVFAYLTGRTSAREAAELERHLAGCDRCVARARWEYRSATEPAWWTPQAPEPVPERVAAPAPVPARHRQWVSGRRFVPALAFAAILMVACGYLLWNITRPPSDPVIASLMDGAGQVNLTQSGKIVLPGRTPPPASLSASVRELFTNKVVKQPANIELALAATRTDRLERGAAADAAEDPMPLSPLATAVRETYPTFSWRPVAPAVGYILYIVDRNKKLVWSGPAGKRTSFTLPSAAPELVRGEVYRWQVEATVKDQPPRLSRGWESFVVLDAAGLAAVTAGEKLYSNSALLLGSLYEAHGLYAEAETQFRRLAELNPSSRLPGQMLGSLNQLRRTP
jgi:hypothetical protein